MNRITFPLAVGLLAVAHTCLGEATEGRLPGFDAESRACIQNQEIELRAIRAKKQGTHGESIGSMHLMLRFLMPFCSDLRPYERRVPAKEKDDHDYWGMRKMSQFLRPEWLPGAWSKGEMREDDALRQRECLSTSHKYTRVPETVFPIFTWPGKAPTLFNAYEMRKGHFACTTMVSWLYRVIVIHQDEGFGVANPTAEQLAGIRDRHLRFPPDDLTLPKGWSSVF